MTKKNLKPQQAAPVQREINTTSCEGGTGMTPLHPCGDIMGSVPFCRRRRGVILPILTLTSKSVKSLFLSPLAHDSHL